MKRIISGKLYNTETAELIGEWRRPQSSYRDFQHYEEELYITRKGIYFLHGEGGPMSPYATHNGNSTSGGESIEPMTKQEAMSWAEEKLTAEEYEIAFGKAEEA